MTVRRFRIPGLQVPQTSDGELSAFLNAVKERLELHSGERGDPESRAVTARELKDIGVIGVRSGRQTITIVAPRSTSTGSSGSSGDSTEELDFSLYPEVLLAGADLTARILIQGDQVSDRKVIRLSDLLTIFVRRDQEQELDNNFLFKNPDGFEVVGTSPGFFFVEIAEGDGVEDTRPADTSVWKVEIEDGTLTVYAYNDDRDTRTALFTITRDVLDALTTNFFTDNLQHNGSQVLVEVGDGLAKAGATVSLSHLGLEDLVDPAAQRLVAWDDAGNKLDWLDPTTLPFKKLDEVLTPDQILADQNDYEPTGIDTATVLRLSSDAARVITGLVPGDFVIFNVGSFDITLSAENVLSVAENRFALIGDLVIPPNGSATLWYDEVSARHRCSASVT